MTDRGKAHKDDPPGLGDILWTPSPARINACALTSLMRKLANSHGAPCEDDVAFHQWTVDHPDVFWRAVWDDCNVIGDLGSPDSLVVDDPLKMPGAKWFPDARLNYAENLLRPRTEAKGAVLFRREDGLKQSLNFAELRNQVSRCAQVFQAVGVVPGDRVAAYMPNCPETLIAMLAATALGAVFSSASPDFGVRGVLDRFGQIEPKVLIAANGYVYNGTTHDRRDQVSKIVEGLPSLATTLLVPFVTGLKKRAALEDTRDWKTALAAYEPEAIPFARLRFDHPLFIMFSSGTTGAPKCIVHGHGGTLLQHVKEHRYHLDIRASDRVFYFTTCGWMMWNWMVTALASEAVICLFDGAPTFPEVSVLFDYAVQEKMAFFGTSAKFIDALKSVNADLSGSHDLSALRTIGSTGSPLSPESFSYVYSNIKSDVHLASIAGGTDIVGCFMTGNPRLPVRCGEIQRSALAMDVAVFDPNGKRLEGEPGELVCANAFPSMPVGFWNDDDGSRYRAAYFDQSPGVWTHGDWVEQTESGGFIIHGRSDATLNPGGVRIGTAEIYRVVEGMKGISEALVVGQDWQGDVRVILFVTLSPGAVLDEELIKEIKRCIRSECSPRHTPSKVVAVDDLPRTRSGKISELAVRDIIHNRPIKNTEALANPEVLDQYKDRPELQD